MRASCGVPTWLARSTLHFIRKSSLVPKFLISFTMDTLLHNATEASKKYPKLDMKYGYGTAGFRGRAKTLQSVMFRMGMLASLRSRAKDGQAIGVMITASHNPVYDNGVKLVDPMDEMLNASWEKFATALANAEDIASVLKEIVVDTGVELAKPAKVFIARDTRPSGLPFTKALMDGIQAMGGIYHDFGKDIGNIIMYYGRRLLPPV